MRGTRWRSILYQMLQSFHRELKITLTPFPAPDRWVFVVGCYNSGTTLLAEMLGEHPSIGGLPTEGQYLTDQLPSDHLIGLSRMWVHREDLYRLTENDIGPDVDRIKREWAMRIRRGAPVFLEKTPANGARMRWLQANFENACFVSVIRNGYAVAEGISRKAKPIHSPEGWSVAESAYQWKRSNEIIDEDSKYIDNFMWVRYEDLTKDPQGSIRSICRFIGVDEGRYFDYNKKWSIHEKSEHIRNMNQSSFDALTEDDIATIDSVAGEALDHFGYERLSRKEGSNKGAEGSGEARQIPGSN